MKGGRRLFLISSAAGRALLCLALAMYISKPAPEGLLVYPLAFGVLVLQKGSAIAKSALVPAAGERRRASSSPPTRAWRSSTRSARSSAPRPRSSSTSSSAPTGRCATARSCSSIATILAHPDPAHATPRARRRAAAAARTGGDAHAEHPARFEPRSPCCGRASASWCSSPRSRSRAISSRSASAGVAAYVGNFGGVLVAPSAPALGARRGDPRVVARAPRHLHPARCAGRRVRSASCSPRARSGSAPRPGGSGSTASCSATVPTRVRGRAFAKFETRFQLVWVIGGIIAIIPFAKQMGLFLLAIVLGFAAISYVAALRAARGRADAHEAPARGGRPHDLADPRPRGRTA